MVNRGDGGSRRPAPPPAGRPGARPPARPAADEGEEKTSAINLADVNLDDIDEMPAPAAKAPPAKAPAPPAKRPAPPPTRSYGADEGEEKTSAINLADIDLDDEPKKPAPPPARPAPAAKKVEPPAPAKKAAPAHVDDGNEKTSAINLDEIDLDDIKPSKAPPAKVAPPAAHHPQTLSKPTPAAKVPAPTPKAEPAPPAKKAAEPVVEKTMAVSLEEFEQRRPSGPKGKAEPAAADRTFLVDDEEAPVVKAPVAKKPAALAGKAEAAPAAAASGGDIDPKFVVRIGADVGRVYNLTKDLTLVGRGLDADFVINDASASRKHFNIVRTLSGWKLVDLGSGNGTKVNGNRVSEISLQHGMKVEVGGTTMEWVVEEPAPAAKPAAAGGNVGRQTVKEDPTPARHPGTLASGGGGGAGGGDDDMMAGVKRRTLSPDGTPGAEVAKRRDLSKMKFDDDKAEGGKGGGGGGGEEKTTFGDIAALEIDPGWEARRQKTRKEGVSDDMVPVSGGKGFGPAGAAASEEGEEAAEEEVEVKKGGAGKKIAIAFGIVAVLGGGFVAADKFGGLGIIFPKEAPKPAVVEKPKDEGDKPKDEADKPKDEGDKPKDEADKPKDETDKPTKEAEADAGSTEADGGAVAEADAGAGDAGPAGDDAKKGAADKAAEGQKALDGKQPIGAKVAFAAALKLDPDNEAAKKGLDGLREPLGGWSSYIAGLKLAADKKWPDAAKELEKIKDTDAVSADARALHTYVTYQHANELAAQALAAYDKKDFAGAKAAVEGVLAIDGMASCAEAAGYKSAIEKALAPDADTLDVADPADPKGKDKVKPVDFKPFFTAYGKADLTAALAALDSFQPQNGGKPANKADASRAAAMQLAAFTVEGLLQTSIDGVKGDKPVEAIASLYNVRRADAFLGGGLQAKIESAMAAGFVALAKKATTDKDDSHAAAYVRMALVFDPNNADAKGLIDDLVKAAKQKVADGKAALDKEADKAAALLLDAVRVLPSDDPDFAEAWKALEPLAKFD